MSGPFTFTDGRKNEWDLKITLGTSVRLEEEGLAFHKLAEGNCAGFFQLQLNDGAFAAILWGIVRPQAEKKAPVVTRAEFFDAVTDGDTFYKAWEVFAAAYANFTRDPQIRSALEEALGRQTKMRAKAAQILKDKSAQFEEAQAKFLEEEKARMTPETMLDLLRSKAQAARAEAEEQSRLSHSSTPQSGPSGSPGS